MVENFLIWSFLGLVIGWGTTRVHTVKGLARNNIMMGIAAAAMGGLFFTALTSATLAVFNPWSTLVAIIGATVGISIWDVFVTPRTY